MKKMLGFAVVITSLLLTLPEAVHGQKKDQKNDNVVKASAQDYKNLERVRELTGIIAYSDAKGLTLRLDFPHVQPNQKAPTPRRGRGYAAPGVKVVHDYKEYDLDMDTGVVVKKMFVTVDYDDKGYLKANDEQAKELRAKGFIAAKPEDIKSGNVAKLVLVMPKGEKVEGAGNVDRPVVKSVYLLKEGTPVAQSAPEKKKKKN